MENPTGSARDPPGDLGLEIHPPCCTRLEVRADRSESVMDEEYLFRDNQAF